MKKILVTAAFLAAAMAMAQVGINNESPQATLDVTAKTTDGSKPEGIIAPRLTGDQIKGKDAQYLAAQKGAIVYATSASADAGVAATKTINITAEGYYYFDGAIWQKFNSGAVAGTEPWYDVATNAGATANTQNIYQMGNVGVGLIAPTSKLHAYQEDTDPTLNTYPTINGNKIVKIGNVTTNKSYRAGSLITELDGTSTTTFENNPLIGLRVGVTDVSASNYTTTSGAIKGGILGIYNLMSKTGSGTIDQVTSTYNQVQIKGSVLSNWTIPNRTQVNVGSSQKQPLITLTSNEVTQSTSNIGDLTYYDAVLGDPSSFTGTIDNLYGYYVNASLNYANATNKWAFYNDANIPSYFKGYVGIGTNTPGRPLEIVRETPTGSVANSGIGLFEFDNGTGTNGAQISSFFARGTKAAPIAPTTGTTVGNYNFHYYANGSFTNSSNNSAIKSVYRGDGSNYRSDLIFYTAGASGASPRLYIAPEGNVGIGTTAPTNKLHVTNPTAGAIRIEDGTQQAGRVLTSDANGVGTWQAPSIGNKTAVVRFTGNHTIASSSVAGASATKEIIPGTVLSSDITGLSANNNGELILPAGKYMVFVSHDVDAGEYCIFKAKINDTTDVYTTYYGEWLNTSFIVDMPSAGFISFYSLGLLGSINPNPTYYVQDYTNIGIQNTVTVLKLN